MTRLMIMGDWHADLKLGWRIAQTWESRNHKHIDGIVQVGDFGVSMKWLPWNDLWAGNFAVPFPTLVIMGNHEDPAAIRSWQADPERIVDLTLLPDGGVVDFLGVKIGGIHGNYSPVSYANPERVALHRSAKGNSHKIAMHIYRPSVEKLLEYDGPMDMLITHDSARICFPAAFRGPMPDGVPEILGLSPGEQHNAKGC